MMHESQRGDQASFWQTSDLAYVIGVLSPETKENGGSERLIRSMREDPDLLEGMLSDERLFHKLMDKPQHLLEVSARLFFSVLLNRTRQDLRKQTFTFERENRFSVVVFDTSTVLALLDDRTVRYYLAELLSSFVRIDKTTLYLNVKPNILEKMQVDDFDIESLIQFSRKVDTAQRVLSCMRIGDICLFLLGVFADYVDVQQLLPGAWFRAKSRKEIADCGSYYYREALKQPARMHPSLEYALDRLSRDFLTAVKPIMYVSSRYLGFIRRTAFLQ